MLGEPLGEEAAAALADSLRALADPVRLRMISLLSARPSGEVCACELVEPTGRAQPTVSHHLKVLHGAGLVERRRAGSWIWYRLVPERLAEVRAALAPVPIPAPVEVEATRS